MNNLCDWLKNIVKNNQRLPNILRNQKSCVCVCVCVCTYKMVDISKKSYENNGIEVIVDSVNALWLNERHIEEQLGHKNLPAVTNKYDKIYKKHR